MNTLIVYNIKSEKSNRSTVMDSIFCFKDYGNKHFYYYNYKGNSYINKILKLVKFDVVLFHYTFMGIRWDNKEWKSIINDFKDCWPEAVKGIIPQDEYYKTNSIRNFSKNAKINIIYTLASGKDIDKLYGDFIDSTSIYTVLTGYVNNKTVIKVQNELKKYKTNHRKYAIGYRARELNFSLGQHATLKTKLVDDVNKRLENYLSNTNIMNTTYDDKNVFWGWDWYKFLLDCDTTLGCKGGASILDEDGKIESMVNLYIKKHPGASFKEVSSELLEPYENSINYTMISPRIFECARTTTCQIFLEDDYRIIRPGIHYINLKRDFSNFDEVVKKVQNKKYCAQIAENAYKELIVSGKYSYEKYVKRMMDTIEKNKKFNVYNKRKQWWIVLLLKIYNLFIINF